MSHFLIKTWAVAASGFVVAAVAWTAKDGLEVKNKLKNEGQIVAAQVSGFRTVHPAKSSPCEAAQYVFSASDGKSYTGTLGCSESQKQKLKLGSLVAITYLPSSPSTNLPGTFTDYSFLKDVLTVFTFTALSALSLLALGILISRLTRKNPSKQIQEYPQVTLKEKGKE